MQHVVQTHASFMFVSVSPYKPCLVDFVGHVDLVCSTLFLPTSLEFCKLHLMFNYRKYGNVVRRANNVHEKSLKVCDKKNHAWLNLVNLYVNFITWVVELGVALCVRKEFNLGEQVS